VKSVEERSLSRQRGRAGETLLVEVRSQVFVLAHWHAFLKLSGRTQVGETMFATKAGVSILEEQCGEDLLLHAVGGDGLPFERTPVAGLVRAHRCAEQDAMERVHCVKGAPISFRKDFG
jgi:hypothetical protein